MKLPAKLIKQKSPASLRIQGFKVFYFALSVIIYAMDYVKQFHQLSKRLKLIFLFSFIAILVGLFVFIFLLIVTYPPAVFPINQVVEIQEGDSLKRVALNFEKQNLVRSAFWFKTIGWILRTEKKIKTGEYFFEEKIDAVSLMTKISSDTYQKNFLKITIPEGFTLRDIAFLFENKGIWQAEELWETTGLPTTKSSLEGFLFPDTYYIPTNISPESMVKIMLENFDKKTEGLFSSEDKKRDVVTMASLLEKEASTEKDKKTISGILWKRLEVGMPLQVDAVFPYIIGKYSLQLTTKDLKVDSPYNTYLYKGLPPGPIANPGLKSIEAALSPTESPYWFYLSDKDENVHYSATYDEHLLKKERYLR